MGQEQAKQLWLFTAGAMVPVTAEMDQWLKIKTTPV